MNKILTVGTILFSCFIVLWVNYSDNGKSEIKVVKSIKDERIKRNTSENTSSINDSSLNRPIAILEKNTQTNHELPAEIANMEMPNLPKDFSLPTTNDLGISSAMSAGFTDAGAKAISSSSPDDLLSVDDMPEQIRNEIKENLKFIQENGYEEVSDITSHEIVNIVNYLNGSSQKIENITFEPSITPEYIEDNYNYIGYSYPNFVQSQSSDIKSNDTVRRVYQDINNNGLLVLEESSLNGGGATLLKEYVNDKVGEYPATYVLKKTEQGETYATLNWITDSSVYTLYQVDNVDNSTQSNLNKAAYSVSEQNKATAVNSDDENAPVVNDGVLSQMN